MKKAMLELNKNDLYLLRKHFSQDISYGVGGTFGNGEDFDSKREFNRAKKILLKIEQCLGLMK